MKSTVLALTAALLLAGGAATMASADPYHHGDRGHRDSDRDGVPNRYDNDRGALRDPDRDRYNDDDRGARRDGDRDRDGVPNRYDHWDNSVRHDYDHDGIPNHWDNNNRWDNNDNRWDRNRFRYGQQHVYWSIRPYSGPRYVAPYGYRYNRWQAGSYLPRGYYGNSYYVNYQPYGLPQPPYGYRWNRVDNDVYLIAITSGLISEVVYDLFR